MNKSQKQVDCESLEATGNLGTQIGKLLCAGTVLGLTGTLGSGKTNLTQSIAAGLDIESGNVVSPTFTICVPHQGRHKLLHLDAYRISSLLEVDELALDESVEDGAVLIIEWADLILDALPPVDLMIHAVHIGESSRQFNLTASSAKGIRLIEQLS